MTTNTAKHAEQEISILSALATDPENRPVIEPFKNEVLALCEAFGKSGQSGGSAPMTARILSRSIEKLLLRQPIAPLTGSENEWMEVAENLYQNVRCGAVFTDKQKAWYLDAIIWSRVDDRNDQFNGTVEGYRSHGIIKQFPFTPKTFYIDVRRERFDATKHDPKSAVSGSDGDYVYFMAKSEQLNAVWELYTPVLLTK